MDPASFYPKGNRKTIEEAKKAGEDARAPPPQYESSYKGDKNPFERNEALLNIFNFWKEKCDEDPLNLKAMENQFMFNYLHIKMMNQHRGEPDGAPSPIIIRRALEPYELFEKWVNNVMKNGICLQDLDPIMVAKAFRE